MKNSQCLFHPCVVLFFHVQFSVKSVFFIIFLNTISTRFPLVYFSCSHDVLLPVGSKCQPRKSQQTLVVAHYVLSRIITIRYASLIVKCLIYNINACVKCTDDAKCRRSSHIIQCFKLKSELFVVFILLVAQKIKVFSLLLVALCGYCLRFATNYNHRRRLLGALENT